MIRYYCSAIFVNDSYFAVNLSVGGAILQDAIAEVQDETVEEKVASLHNT